LTLVWSTQVLGFGLLALTGAEALLTTWFLEFVKGGEFDNIMRQAWPSTGNPANPVADFVGGFISTIVVAILVPIVLVATLVVPALALSAGAVAGILGSGLFWLCIRSLLAVCLVSFDTNAPGQCSRSQEYWAQVWLVLLGLFLAVY
jgi:hypothetical protein